MSANADNSAGPGAIPAEPPVPKALKHFRLEGLLAKGGMGMVYRGYDTRLHRPVAVKLLSSELTADPDRKQRLLQEARAAARISHPAIAQIHYVDEEEGVTFIVMEFVEGKTVRDLIDRQELDLLGVVDLGLQVAEGLAKADAQGVIHRDIKPANVMLTPDGHAKILDFGLAKLLEKGPIQGPEGTQRLNPEALAQTQSGVVLGTPAYMSPEQVRGLPVDGRADIFSLGVLLFEMATGTSPFQRSNLMDVLHAVVYEEAPRMNTLRTGIPDELQRIVSRCLSKTVEHRYADASSLAKDLRVLRHHTESGLVQKTSWGQRLAEAWEQLRHLPPSRYGWSAVGAAGVVLALYFSLSKIGTAGVISLSVVGLLLYRHIRNRPHRVQELLVRRLSKIPEVRLVAVQDRQFTVVVDHPVAQLYSRINRHVTSANRKLYAGRPMTVSILHEISGDQLHQMLAGPGVHYVRHDALEAGRQKD